MGIKITSDPQQVMRSAVAVLALSAVVCVPTVLGPLPGRAARAEAAVAEPERLWIIGARAFEDGLYREAYRILGRFIEIAAGDPRRGDAGFLRGRAALALGRHGEALAELQAAERFPIRAASPGEVIFWQAECLFNLRRFTEARARYSRFLEAEPDSPYADNALYALGAAQLAEGRVQEAIDAYKTLATQRPRSPFAAKAEYGAALELVRARRWDEAQSLLRTFDSRHPASPLRADADYLLGITLIEKGQKAEGARRLEQFVARAPSHDLIPQARALLGDTYVEMDRSRDGLLQYRIVAEQTVAPALVPHGLYQVGALSMRLGWLDEAEAAWKRLRRDYPEDSLAAFAALGLADLYAKRREFDQAAETARIVARIQGPERLRGLLLVAENAAKARKPADAEEAYAALLAEAPPGSPEWARAVDGHILLGDTVLEAGQAADAERLYRVALDRTPAGARPRERALAGLTRVADALRKTGERAEAERLYVALLAESPPESPTRRETLNGLLRLGESLLAAQQIAGAERVYSLVRVEAPKHAVERFHALAGLGALAEARGDADEARRAYTEIVQDAEDSELLRWTRGRLGGLAPAEETGAGQALGGPRAPQPPTRAEP